jgi:hypothetical protein
MLKFKYTLRPYIHNSYFRNLCYQCIRNHVILYLKNNKSDLFGIDFIYYKYELKKEV